MRTAIRCVSTTACVAALPDSPLCHGWDSWQWYGLEVGEKEGRTGLAHGNIDCRETPALQEHAAARTCLWGVSFTTLTGMAGVGDAARDFGPVQD